MKEIYINADDYNSDSIKTIQGNNNAEEYKIYLQYDNEKIDLTGKTVNLAFLKNGSTEGDIIENLNVTNPKEGEITLKITNKISKRNGTYSCQLAILGEGDFLEHTATFTLTVENNIFSDITKAIADSKDFTYLERILEEASKLSEKLKENTSSATNANSNLESNIIEANNINSKLLENTSTATSLNKNLESNINLAKEVKETIKDLDTKNIEATEKIETLTGLNSKAEELSNNINQALPLNSELVKNTESAKTANNELIATNNDAKVKKTDLDNSLEEAKKYISGLDGSKNPVQMQLDINELKNGLKSNQSLSYEGSSISADNTLEGRTEGMRIKGRTLKNIFTTSVNNLALSDVSLDGNTFIVNPVKGRYPTLYDLDGLYRENTNYTVVIDILENTLQSDSSDMNLLFGNASTESVLGSTLYRFDVSNGKKGRFIQNVKTIPDFSILTRNLGFKMYMNNNYTGGKLKFNIMVIETSMLGTKQIPSYFGGIKSFGEAEGNKISILSYGSNILDYNEYIGTLSIAQSYKKQPISLKANIDYRIELVLDNIHVVNENICIWTFRDENRKNIKQVAPTATFRLTDSEAAQIKTIDLFIGNNETVINKKITSIQLKEGTKNTTFEPYKEDKKDILLKEPLHEGNYLYEDNGQVKVYEKKKKYTFTGDEDFCCMRQTDEYISFYCNVNPNLNLLKSEKMICNNFCFVTNRGQITEALLEGFTDSSMDNRMSFSINKSKLSSLNVEGFKAWLKAHPTEIIYQLATPVTEVVENCVDIDLDTYQEKAYFNILNSLPGTLDFKVPSNIASIVQNTAREVNNIWDVINNLLVPGILDVNKKVALATIKNNLK
ncbi:Domain of uncharacterised function (DUF2479) [Clostridium perfringens]|nr:BppU family phage baseplate upper protein [Clostridium perfringens]SQB35248.1 Domain of uncharacterised function (DUF2479) [Clostridium perfringens]